MSQPTIVIDSKLLDGVIQALQVSTTESPPNPAGAGYALGVLTAVRAANVEQKTQAVDLAAPYRREVELLSAAIKRAGFRIDRFGSGADVMLYPIAASSSKPFGSYYAELTALKAAVRAAGFDIALLCGGGVALRRRPDPNTALSTQVELTLPWPPSVNRIWRAVGGRIILALTARRFKAAAARALPIGRVPPPLTGRLVVWFNLHPPGALTKRGQVWDIANREKLVCDALTAQRVWLDDSQIDVMVLLRGEPCENGRVAVTIHEIPPGAKPL